MFKLIKTLTLFSVWFFHFAHPPKLFCGCPRESITQNRSECKDWGCHIHQEGMKRFMTFFMGLSGANRVDTCRSWLSWGKEEGDWHLDWVFLWLEGRPEWGRLCGLAFSSAKEGTCGLSYRLACMWDKRKKAGLVIFQQSAIKNSILIIIWPISVFICERFYLADSLYLVWF